MLNLFKAIKEPGYNSNYLENKDKNIVEKCKEQQLYCLKNNIIKEKNDIYHKKHKEEYGSGSGSECESEYESQSTLYVNNSQNILICNNIRDELKNNLTFKKQYYIQSTIYQKRSKAVYIIKSKIKNKKYVIKIRYNDACNSEYNVYNKIKLINNRLIMKPLEFVKEDRYYWYVYEYFKGYNLNHFLKETENITEIDLIDIFMKILKGVKILHDVNILHRDLKIENIMINKKNDIKIIDFDLSKSIDDGQEYVEDTLCGTIQYIAPESYDLNIYSKKSDVWSLGIIFYIMITKKYPYSNDLSLSHSLSNFYRRNEFKHPKFDLLEEKVNKLNYNKKIVKLLKNMLEFVDTKRISVDEAIIKLNRIKQKI